MNNRQLIEKQQREQMAIQAQMQQDQMNQQLRMQVAHEVRQIAITLYIERVKRLIDSGDYDDLTFAECERIGEWAEKRAWFVHKASGLAKVKNWDQPEEPAAEQPKSPIITE